MDIPEAIKGLHDEAPDRDYVVVSNAISRQLHTQLSGVIAAQKGSSACTLFLATHGGQPDGGYRIARCLRHHYAHLRVVVSGECKSAGTLIAIAADELAIGDLGELGPLDIQVRKDSELEESGSGLDIMQALGAATQHVKVAFHQILRETRKELGLSTKLCAEFAAQVSAGIAGPLFSQVDPIRLGEMQRATRIAYEYGKRLNEHSKNLREGSLERLVSDYPSHSFVIDRKEARELFHRVSALSPAESDFTEVMAFALQTPGAWSPEMMKPPVPATIPTASVHTNDNADEGAQPRGIDANPPNGDDRSEGFGQRDHDGAAGESDAPRH